MSRWLPFSLVLAAAAVAGVVVHQGRGLLDLAVYRYGGRAVLDGIPLYAGADPVTDLPFTYPPFAALVMAPMALLPGWALAGLWTAASAAALLATVHLVHPAAEAQGAGAPAPVGSGRRWRVAVLAAAAVAMEPVWQTFSFGQVNLLLMLAIAVDLLRPDRRWAGVLVGVAAGIKLTPLIFVVLLLLLGRRTAAGRAVLTFLGTVAVGFLVLSSSAWTYWTSALRDPERVGGPAYSSNQSLYGELTRSLDGPPPMLVWMAVAGPIALAVLVIGARVWRSGDRVLGTALGGVAMVLASPISWSHHWVWALPVAAALLQRSRGWAASRSPVAVGVFAGLFVGVFVVAPIWWVPHGRDAELDWSLLEHLPGNAYLISGLVLAAWTAWTGWTGRTAPTRSGRRGSRGVAGMDREHALDRA